MATMRDVTTTVDPELVRARLGIAFPMDNKTRDRIEEAIEDSTANVLTYLNRDTFGGDERTIRGLYVDERFALEDVKAWPAAAHLFDDRYRVKSWVGNVEDPERFDVTFVVGLDLTDPECAPIVRFIVKDAAADLYADASFTGVERAITSLSAEGQSVSYDRPKPTAGQPGSGLTLASLKRWKRVPMGRVVRSRPLPVWPYYS